MAFGIIGGSGLYEIDGFTDVEEHRLETPFGDPSDVFVTGKLFETHVVFLARHGRGHRIMPSEINHRANIYGMKVLGADRVLGVSAVGSFREGLAPRDIVMVDQYVDRTKQSTKHSFFGDGIVAHIPFAHPICPGMRKATGAVAASVLAGETAGPGGRPPAVHMTGTYLNMEGPAFSTRAESFLYKAWGMDVIGMTSLAEAKLCREAEVCFCTMAMVTDYDCWHNEHEEVSVELVIQTLVENAHVAKAVIAQVAAENPNTENCACHSTLENAIITAPDSFPPRTRQKLSFLLDKPTCST